MRPVISMLLAILVAAPAAAGAEDGWIGSDKAKHFGAGAAIAAGGYAVTMPVTRSTKWRIAVGTSAGIGAGAGKELADRSRGTPSWRDFAWSAAGTAAGVLVAWTFDKLSD